jgi:hypothetical protein
MTQLTSKSVRMEQVSSRLALQVATKLYSTQDILKQFNLSPQEYKTILQDPVFQKKYREAKELWNSDTNALERIRAKSTMAVEDGLLTLVKIFKDQDLNANARLDAFEKLIKLSEKGCRCRRRSEFQCHDKSWGKTGRKTSN